MPPSDSLRLSVVLPASAERLYKAWLDPKEHTSFTGAAATGTGKSGGKFTAWDGYITGKYLELEPPSGDNPSAARIVAAWRTADFTEDHPDSRLEVLFHPASGGTRVTIAHSELPLGDGERYKGGWEKFYFEPMRAFFRAASESKILAADAKRGGAQKVAARARPPASRPPRTKG